MVGRPFGKTAAAGSRKRYGVVRTCLRDITTMSADLASFASNVAGYSTSHRLKALPGLCGAHALRAIGRQQQPPRPSSKRRGIATGKHSGEQSRNYAMTGKDVCRIHCGASPLVAAAEQSLGLPASGAPDIIGR